MRAAWTAILGMLAAATLAADNRPLGAVHFGVKGGYLAFTDSTLKDDKVDTGPLVGAELYFHVVEGLYLGAEGGYIQNKGKTTALAVEVENKLTYAPLELNAKYAWAPVPWLALDVGGGACCGYGKFELTVAGLTADTTDWMPGGQGFANLNLLAGPLYLGVDGKIQLVRKFKDSDFNLNNWRVGAHLGLAF